MNPSLILVFMVGLIFLFIRMRSRRRTPVAKPRPPMQIQGKMVQTYLHPRIGSACLADSEVQFGPGFRRKESPELPHDPYCRCAIVPFNFTSSEVFNGALRRLVKIDSSIPGLPLETARVLISRLKILAGKPLPASESAFLEACELKSFPETYQAQIQAFLMERYAHEQHPPPVNTEEKADPIAPSPSVTDSGS